MSIKMRFLRILLPLLVAVSACNLPGSVVPGLLPTPKPQPVLTSLMEHHSNELPWRRPGYFAQGCVRPDPGLGPGAERPKDPVV